LSGNETRAAPPQPIVFAFFEHALAAGPGFGHDMGAAVIGRTQRS
jgi:hypothetical protein